MRAEYPALNPIDVVPPFGLYLPFYNYPMLVYVSVKPEVCELAELITID